MTDSKSEHNHFSPQTKQQYTDRIDCLKEQIIKQNDEIKLLKYQLNFISEGKIYDC